MKPKVQKKKQKNLLCETTKDSLVSLVSNSRCIEASSKHPWWIALIIAIVAIWLPVFPIMNSYSHTSGAAFVGEYGYGFQDQLVVLTDALCNKEPTKQYNIVNKVIDFKVNNISKKLDIYDLDNNVVINNDYKLGELGDFAPIASYISCYTNATDTSNPKVIYHQTEFEIYFISGNFKTDVTQLIDYLSSRKYELDTTNTAWSDSSLVDAYTPSFLVLYETGLYCRIYKQNTSELSGATLASDWKHTKSDVFLVKDRLLKVKDVNVDVNSIEYIDAVYKNWKSVFSETYETQKQFNVTFFMGLYIGVYAVLVLLMGLLVFFMTRGKHNIFNYLTFVQCHKIAWWASLSPALLAMILSFIMPGLASMLFIVLMGLRIMWLSMKQLRPQ